MKKNHLQIFSLVIGIVFFALPGISNAMETVSVNNANIIGNQTSEFSSISQNGRYVAIESSATNLVSGDTNGVGDIFVYDRDMNTVERVSIDNAGVEGDGSSQNPSISSDGRYVAFHSLSSNFVSGDTNGTYDVFVYDRDTNTIERVSIDNAGVEGNDISSHAFISADGRYVVFQSFASNLIGNDTNAVSDVFVYDRDTNTIERVSIDNAGVEGNNHSYLSYGHGTAISLNGRYVTFSSGASNLVPSDTNGTYDIFVYDLNTNTIKRVSVNNAGLEGNSHSELSSISGNAKYITFESTATNLVPGDTNGTKDVFAYDLKAGTIKRVSVNNAGLEGNDYSYSGAISLNGRYVTFSSGASNLVPSDTNGTYDIFVYDLNTNTIKRVSVNNAGLEGNDYSIYPSISGNGQYVAFASLANNFVAGDTNGALDIFVNAI